MKTIFKRWNLFPFRRKMERNILSTLCHVSWFFVIEITNITMETSYNLNVKSLTQYWLNLPFLTLQTTEHIYFKLMMKLIWRRKWLNSFDCFVLIRGSVLCLTHLFTTPKLTIGLSEAISTVLKSRYVQGWTLIKIWIPYDNHHKGSSLVKSHQNTHNSVRYEVIWKC